MKIDFQRNKKATSFRGFPLEQQCVVQGFIMTIQSKDSDLVEVTNEGEYFNTTSLSLLEIIKANDIFYFDKIKYKCPGG